ncbi:hypothetical protein CTI12_AA602370 [Artemisia annua]|uniref:Uncharacterized protein n=1 Tax=Artemisia annua TaxID=35608 RepID=A0A2U1KHC2_ARTAN|nr:hypothetical protein CTI12_AA602370 [Artemisia annua]
MEIESSSAPTMSKRLRKEVKIVLYMLRKTLAKTKLLVDLHIKLKNGKLARKAFTSLLLRQRSTTFTCRYTSHDIETLFISPQKHKTQSSGSICKSYNHQDGENKTESAAFEALNNGSDDVIEQSPMVLPTMVSPGVRKVDLPLHVEEEISQVDKAAEAFINKFYKQLKQQQITYVESPSPNHMWA